MPSALFHSALLVSATATSVTAAPTDSSPVAPRPLAYRLDLTVLPDRPRFAGHVEIDVDLPRASSSIAIDGQALHVTHAALRQSGGETAATYHETNAAGHARLNLASPAAAGRATLVLDYDAAFGNGLAGLYHYKSGDNWYATSHLETKSARRAFPGIDRPGYKTPFTVSIATAPGLAVASNSAERSATAAGSLVRHDFATTAPLPSYLLAFAVGPFAVSSTSIAPDGERPIPVPLRILAPQGAGSTTLALTQTGPILRQLEHYMGRPYPYAKLDQIASPLMFGGMENAGAIVYQQSVLLPANPRNPASQAEFVREVSHELSHQWFGDLVTPKSWSDLWLNESFANWMSYRIGDRWRPELHIGAQLAEEAIDALGQDELAASHPVHQPTDEDAEPFFDSITYGKGAQVLGMFEAYIGEDSFRVGLQAYLRRFANRNADTDDFFTALADTTHDPHLLAALRGFVEQPGVPVIRLDRTLTGFRLSQSRYAQLGDSVTPQRWSVPVCYRVDTKRACVMLDKPQADVAVRDARVLMPNAGGTGYYRFALSPADWRALIATSASMTPAEAVMTTDSLWASFASGEIGPDLLIYAARRMAANPFGPAAIDGGKRLASLWHQGLIPPEHKARYRYLLMSIYRPLLDSVGIPPTGGAQGTAERQQLRIGVERLLAEEAADPEVRLGLAASAAKALGGDPDVLEPGLSIPGYAAYLAVEPATRVPALFSRLTTATHSGDREIVAYALGTGRNQEGTAWLLDHLSDPLLSPLDRWHVLYGLTEDQGSRMTALPWTAAHLDLLNGVGWNTVIGLANNACSATDARLWTNAVRPHIASDGNAALVLRVTQEKITNCAALRDRRGRDVAASLD